MYINFDSSYKTLYMKLYDSVKQKIIDGELAENSKLPSIRSMMSICNVSKNTVIEAFYQLELEGYIRSEEKRGFYVNKLEHLVVSKPIVTKPSNSVAKVYEYDFSVDGVDSSGFPYSIWKNIFSDVMSSRDADLLLSAEPKGHVELRIEIAKYVNLSRGLKLNPEDIIISAGTEHLFNFIKKLFDKDTVYGFENPGYPWGREYFYNDIKNVVPIPVDDEGIMVEELSKKNVRVCLVTPAHQFPTGVIMSVNRRVNLLNRAIETDGYIIEDDYDGEFKYKGKPVAALKSMDLNDRVIYMGTFSKSLSPALRISYMALPKKLMQRYDEYFAGYSCSCSTFIQKALAEFMSRGHFEKHINRMRTVYAKKYEICEKMLKEIREVDVQMTGSGNSFILNIPEMKCREQFVDDLMDSGINLISLDTFRRDSRYSNEFIFGFAKIQQDKLIDGIKILEHLIRRNT